MSYLTQQRQISMAAEPTLERIRKDRQRVPVQVRPLLAHVEAHLFDPDLDGTRLKKACGVRDNSLPLVFNREVGLPPYAYIEDCRMEVACRLLVDTDMKVWQVGQAVGYSALQVFSRAFERLHGVRPTVYRSLNDPQKGTVAQVVALVRGLRDPGESSAAARALDSMVKQVPELRGLWAAIKKPTLDGVSVLDLALLHHGLLTGGVDSETSAQGMEALSRLLRHVPGTAELARRFDEDAHGDVDLAVELALELAAEGEAATTGAAA